MSQVTIHHPSSYGYSGQVGFPATISNGVSATYSYQQLDPNTGYTVTWGGGAPASDTFTSSATGTGSVAHTYATGTYSQVVTNTATGQVVAKRTVVVPYAGGGGFAPRMVEEGGGEEPPPSFAPRSAPAEPEPEPVNGNGGDYFDPADYTVDEVMAWIADNPDELENLIAAEEAGKARVTLLSHLNDLR